MTYHPDEADLLTFHWDGGARTGAHVADCPACAARLAELRALLLAVESAPVPDRSDGYGRDVWARIEPRLRGRTGWRGTLSPASLWRPLAGMAILTALVVAGFLAGRLGAPRPAAEGELRALRERVLYAELSEHLARSESVLLELVNSPAGALDVSTEQARLSELLPANRLYRQSARRAGEPAITGILDELERVLLDVEHGPSQLTAAERNTLARRIEADGVLFRLRVLTARIRTGRPAAPPTESRSFLERKRA